MYIEENIKHLSHHPYHWVAPIDEGVAIHQFMVAEANGDAYFEKVDGSIVKLTDQLDSSYEARTTRKEILFVIGVNAINEIKHLYKTKHTETLIIVIEPNLSFFSYVLTNKNLKILGKDNIVLFADCDIANLTTFLQPILHEINYAKLLKNTSFYLTDYYRNYDFSLSKQCITIIRQTISGVIHNLGNDVKDSLIGLEHNLKNTQYILQSKDVSYLKEAFKNVPAIVVAAGPSLNKNIEQLHKAKNKAVIIAVDTIVHRLLQENIIPDFVCSIERISEVYDYFYKDKDIPAEVTLVGPAVLDTRIFEEYKGELLIPFRNEINETAWLQKMFGLNEDTGISMGSSCAHVAFGLAEHMGCSPIILVGQDLAYGASESETHASGTTYDNQEQKVTVKRDQDVVEGYYGGMVTTTKIWIQFKVWFEKRIGEENLHVIDATEGGARIFYTEQLSLQEALQNYCQTSIKQPKKVIDAIGKYPIDIVKTKQLFIQEIEAYMDLIDEAITYYNKLEKMDITSATFIKYNNELLFIHTLIKKVFANALLFHNLQSVILRYLWEYNGREQIVSVANVQAEKNEQIKLLATMTRTIYEIKANIEEALKPI